jgi:hypothetical protein
MFMLWCVLPENYPTFEFHNNFFHYQMFREVVTFRK